MERGDGTIKTFNCWFGSESHPTHAREDVGPPQPAHDEVRDDEPDEQDEEEVLRAQLTRPGRISRAYEVERPAPSPRF